MHVACLLYPLGVVWVSAFGARDFRVSLVFPQLSTDDWGGDGSYISVVERADPLVNSVDTVCSLYEVSRRP